MGSGGSSVGNKEKQSQDNMERKTSPPKSKNEKPADQFDRSRSDVKEMQNGGEFLCDGDNESVNSGDDSDDTLVLAARMTGYIEGEQSDKGDNGDKADQNNATVGNNENGEESTLSMDDVIAKIAAENYTDPSVVTYDVDTIGYYIVNCVPKTPSDNGVETKAPKEVESNTLDDKASPNPGPKPTSSVGTLEDRYEIFKKDYGNRRPQSRRRSSVANKQTLILARVGTQFKYVAVPAYLPGQKLYKTNTFARPYIERAEGIYKVKRPKGMLDIMLDSCNQ